MSEKDDKKLSLILAALLFIAGGALIVKPELLSNQSDFSSISPEVKVESTIDRNLKSADIRKQLLELKIKMQNEKADRIREMGLDNPSVNRHHSLELEQESHAEAVIEKLEEYEQPGDHRFNDPSDIVERRIARDQAISDYDQKYRKEYVRAFLQNAREQGFDVQLNEDLEVIDIREIQTKDPLRLPNSAPGQGGASQ